jgi:predicted nucleotidyltransferase
MRTIPGYSIDEVTQLARPIFERHPEIEVVYLFGSRAGGEIRATSDYDFGVLCARSTPRFTCLNLGLRLVGELSLALRTDAVDVVMLNTSQSAPLRFAVVTDGVRIFERDADADLDAFELHTRREYEDFMALRRRLGD